MTGQAKAGNVGHRVDAVQRCQIRPGRVEPGRRFDHRAVACGIEQALLQRGWHDPDAKRLAQHQHVARPRPGIARHAAGMGQPERAEAGDRLGRRDRMAARDRPPGAGAGLVPAPQLPGPLYLAQLPSGWSLLGNPLQRAADLPPFSVYLPSPGTTLQTFPDSLESGVISIFDGTEWSANADLQWKQAGAVYNPSEQPLVFGLVGIVDGEVKQPELVEGEQLLVMPTPAGDRKSVV